MPAPRDFSYHLKPLPTRCAIYTRLSRSATSSVSSCETQRTICLDYVKEHVLKLIETEYNDNGVSGETLERPALQRLIADICEKKVDRVIVYSVDRLTRKLRDLHKLLGLFTEHGVELNVVTDPTYGDDALKRLMMNVVGAAAEFEHDLIKERMADARAHLKSKGRRVAGRVPFGYRTNLSTRQLEIEDSDADIVREFFELAATGNTPKQIANYANMNQFLTAGGAIAKWSERQVLKLLSNPTYFGFIHLGESVSPGCHEPIISPELFQLARNQIESRKQPSSSSKCKYKMPLRGVLYCGRCGRAMSSDSSHHDMWRYLYYKCRSTAGGTPPCKGVSIRKWNIESWVFQQIEDDDCEIPGLTRAEKIVLKELWCRFDELKQDELLPIIIDKLVYDPGAETYPLKLNLKTDAIETFRMIDKS